MEALDLRLLIEHEPLDPVQREQLREALLEIVDNLNDYLPIDVNRATLIGLE